MRISDWSSDVCSSDLSYSVDPDPNGELLINRAKGSYNYFLPSANIAFDLSQEVKLRLAADRAIARSGIESFGAGIRLNPSAGTGLDNIIFDATTGNPNLKPLRAWHLDASLELYRSAEHTSELQYIMRIPYAVF